ncbi:MAG: hypothetical protein HKN45_10790 [Flavobacteriales bacterium]|nr:hypothetical protein [Flavobacteriales bacterium]NNK80923.1 hypothetical protein [Flavobacteriales bacterium]
MSRGAKKEIRDTPNYDRNVHAMAGVITAFFPELKYNKREYHLLKDFLSTFWKGVPLIDDALDRLKLSQEDNFRADFLLNFDRMIEAKTKNEYIQIANLFAARYDVILNNREEQKEQLECLYKCTILFKKLDLLPAIRIFSEKMIEVSNEKREASTASEIISILEKENRAISFVFDAFLRTFRSLDADSDRFARMSEFLFLGEQVRNVFDDMVDARSDKKRGEISLPLDYRYYSTMTAHWVNNLYLMTKRFGTRLPIIFSVILREYCGNIWMNRNKRLALES